jgi:hypothetical protein
MVNTQARRENRRRRTHPVQVDHQQIKELVAAVGVLGLKLLHHVPDGYVSHERDGGSHKGDVSHPPVAVEVRAVEVQTGVVKSVQPEDMDGRLNDDRCGGRTRPLHCYHGYGLG